MSEKVPPDKLCACGHRAFWYEVEEDPDTSSVFYEIAEKAGVPHIRMHQNVVERSCPHRNGTVIQHCPRCDAKVGMWGAGVAGGMECDCWDERPWWRRLMDQVVGWVRG